MTADRQLKVLSKRFTESEKLVCRSLLLSHVILSELLRHHHCRPTVLFLFIHIHDDVQNVGFTCCCSLLPAAIFFSDKKLLDLFEERKFDTSTSTTVLQNGTVRVYEYVTEQLEETSNFKNYLSPGSLSFFCSCYFLLCKM